MNQKRQQKLKEFYALIPRVNCKGLCTHECTVLGMLKEEFVLLTRAAGKEPKFDTKTKRCNLLENNRCIAYEARPFVCRAFGADEAMPCPHGCVPIGGFMSRARGNDILQKIQALVGSDEQVFTATRAEMAQALRENGFPEELVIGISSAIPE